MPRIHLFPNWVSNPYTNMLTQLVMADGWQVDGSLTCTEVVAELRKLRRGDVFHIQWTEPIAQAMPDEARAKAGFQSFRKALRDARRAGVAVIWTIHNLLPHATKYPGIEIELCRFLASEADKIIQLTDFTATAARELYVLPPQKLVTLRHASYVGIYGEAPPQAEAREALGIPLSSPTIGFVGQIRHYKGVATLLRAVELLSHRVDDLTLVLAGRTSPSEVESLEREIPRSVRAIRRHSFVPDAELGTWFAACDVMAFPYRSILNSGSIILAATYGVPVIVPAEPNFLAQYGTEEWVHFYSADVDADSNLAGKIEESLSARGSVGRAARNYAESYTSLDMASEYASVVREAVDIHARTVEW